MCVTLLLLHHFAEDETGPAAAALSVVWQVFVPFSPLRSASIFSLVCLQVATQNRREVFQSALRENMIFRRRSCQPPPLVERNAISQESRCQSTSVELSEPESGTGSEAAPSSPQVKHGLAHLCVSDTAPVAYTLEVRMQQPQAHRKCKLENVC